MTAARAGARRWGAACAVLALCCGCQSSGLPSLSDLARDPPLPYSVLVTGGAFITPGPIEEQEAPLGRTFRPRDESSEAFPLDYFVSALDAGRVFVRVEQDRSAPALRRRLAEQEGPAPLTDRPLQALLQRARQDGHDLLLVVEGVEDGPVVYREINGQWPMTLAAWVLIGLGMLVPDHTYESRASLHVMLRDVQTGRPVYGRLQPAGAIDLQLIERTGLLGILVSVIVPPFWVGSDAGDVERTVREAASGRLVGSMARQLKQPDVQEKIGEQMPAIVGVKQTDAGMLVEIEASEGLSVVRVRVDGERFTGPAFSRFEAALLGSVQARAGARHYRAELAPPPSAERLQVLVQTVTGRVASVTVDLGR